MRSAICQTGGMKTALATPSDTTDEIVTIRIDLVDTDPPIWRQVEAPISITLKGLHDVIQAAMGWDDQHLWELRIGSQAYGRRVSGDDDWRDPPMIDADKVRLRDILKPQKTTLDYTYDFGDGWEHRLTITDRRHGEPSKDYPRYVAGERAAPPEDCGGIPGFYAALDARADPDHSEHAEAAEWLDDYDPDQVDQLLLKVALGRIAKRCRAESASRRKPTAS